ncbi:hypothetical protein [Saccharospirillum sp.]|uniref:hypothetical protein n=1 Tax=Saccharospirillum sp. TaxID=2033801 RepID=UPI0034A004B0
MLEFLTENYTVVASVTNIGTLLVWIFYAQLLYSSYRRQRLPRVLINKGVGDEYVDSPCLICNMSQEAVFVYFMIVKLKTSDGIYEAPMTDREGDELPESEGEITLRNRTRQGPLNSGECLEFVSFRRMIKRLLDSAELDINDGSPSAAGIQLHWLEVHVVSIYGPEHKPFGAVRRFSIEAPEEGQQVRLYPDTLDTENRRSFRYRRQINDWLKRYL